MLRRPAGAPRKRKDEWAIMDNSDVSNFEEIVPEMALEVRHLLPFSLRNRARHVLKLCRVCVSCVCVVWRVWRVWRVCVCVCVVCACRVCGVIVSVR